MKVTNSGSKDAVELSQLAKNRKTHRAGAKETQTESPLASALGQTSSVELSGEAKAMSKANSIARSEDIDQAKIDRIKAMIAEKKYNPDHGKVAEKMINENLLQDLS